MAVIRLLLLLQCPTRTKKHAFVVVMVLAIRCLIELLLFVVRVAMEPKKRLVVVVVVLRDKTHNEDEGDSIRNDLAAADDATQRLAMVRFAFYRKKCAHFLLVEFCCGRLQCACFCYSAAVESREDRNRTNYR